MNLSGAFALGLLYGLDVGSRWPDWLAAGAEIGLIGAYTTYSTWAADSLALTRGGAAGWAVANLVGSLAAGVLLAWGRRQHRLGHVNGATTEHHELATFPWFSPPAWYNLGMGSAGTPIILAAYTCRPCDTQGRGIEVSPGLVLCWNCGCPALITARVAG